MATNNLSLPRKYRPSTLARYVGNTKLKNSAFKLLSATNRPQVVLLFGPSGSGKTTMGRLLAKEYACENRDDETGACDECESCRLFDEYIATGDDGVFMNLREYDIANNSNKDIVETIIEDANTPTLDGGWRIIILDECHMASKAAQNALLKLVEEPPERVLLIFCTTDPERMLATLLNRCSYKLGVVKPTRSEMLENLAYVCTEEGARYDVKGLGLIASKSDYVHRQALEDLEMVLNEKGSATYDNAVEVLSVIADKYFFTFYTKLLASDNMFEYIAFIGELRDTLDLKTFVDSVISFTIRGLYIQNGIRTQGIDVKELKTIKGIFSSFTRAEITNLLKSLIDIRNSSADIETKLLLLGYEGLKNPNIAPADDEMLADDTVAGDFSSLMATNVHIATEFSESEIEELATEATDSMDMEGVMQMFGGTLVQDDNT